MLLIISSWLIDFLCFGKEGYPTHGFIHQEGTYIFTSSLGLLIWNIYLELLIRNCSFGIAYLEVLIWKCLFNNYATLQVDLEEEVGYERVKNGHDDD